MVTYSLPPITRVPDEWPAFKMACISACTARENSISPRTSDERLSRALTSASLAGSTMPSLIKALVSRAAISGSDLEGPDQANQRTRLVIEAFCSRSGLLDECSVLLGDFVQLVNGLLDLNNASGLLIG